MATGDVTIVVQVEGGSAKTATVPSASRVNAIAWLNRNRGPGNEGPNLTDATWSVLMANGAANRIIHAASKELTEAAAPSKPTFTAAS
jgi:hypothetical protein